MTEVERKCWTCMYFTYMTANSGVGWCTFGPPIQDVQKDAAIAPVTCHPMVMHSTKCGRWGTDEQIMERVDKEAESQELQQAYNTLAREEARHAALRREIIVMQADSIANQEEANRRVQNWQRQVDMAYATIERLGENPFMAVSAEMRTKEESDE